VLSWGAASMEETASRRNKLPQLFLYLSAAPSGDVGGQVAWSSRRSLEPARFVFGGRWSALLRVTIGTLAGDGCVGSRSCVYCLAVGHVDDGMRRYFSSSIASDKVGDVEI
jgi:hypothetical protein